jgi:elongation factor Ts
MAEITASLVKELRDKTSAGMMDCKKALKETDGDLEAAVDWLRIKGISSSASKGDRLAKEGLIYSVVSDDAKVGVLVEVNCETDFVAKNDGFRAFVDTIATHVHKQDSANDHHTENVLATAAPDGRGTFDEFIKAKVGELGENILLRRFRRYQAADNGSVTSYIHMAGRVGVLLETTTGKPETKNQDAFKNLVKDITLQIAASSPEFTSRSEVTAAAIAKETEIQRERLAGQIAGKPENIQQKIIEGTMGKFFSQICLLEQAFIKEPDNSVEDVVKAANKLLGDTVTIVRFARFAVGEEVKA